MLFLAMVLSKEKCLQCQVEMRIFQVQKLWNSTSPVTLHHVRDKKIPIFFYSTCIEYVVQTFFALFLHSFTHRGRHGTQQRTRLSKRNMHVISLLGLKESTLIFKKI